MVARRPMASCKLSAPESGLNVSLLHLFELQHFFCYKRKEKLDINMFGLNYRK